MIIAVRAKRQAKRGKSATPSRPAPELVPVDAIYWLEPDPKLARSVQRLALISMTALLIPLSIFLALSSALAYLTGQWILDGALPILALAAGAAIAGGLFWKGAPHLFPALGTDGTAFYLRDRRKVTHTYAPEDALMSLRTLKLGRRFVGLANGFGQLVYLPAHFDRHIRPLIDPARHVSEVRMYIEALRNAHAPTWIVQLALVAIIGWMVSADPGFLGIQARIGG